MVRLAIAMWSILMCIVAASARAQDTFDIGATIRSLADGAQLLPVDIGLMTFTDGWTNTVSQHDLRDRKIERTGNTLTLTGVLLMGNVPVQFEQTCISEANSTTRVTYRIETPSDVQTTGVFCSVNVPLSIFGRGKASLDGKSIDVPLTFGEKELLSASNVSKIAFQSPGGSALTCELPEKLNSTIQDGRAFQGDTIGAFITLHSGNLAAKQVIERTLVLKASIPKDLKPAEVTVDFANTSSRFDGFGGNFVYGFDSPQTQANLKTLPMAWARANIMLAEWEPQNDNADPLVSDLSTWSKIDAPGSTFRKRFELDKQLFEMTKGRLIMSNWRLPEWMYEKPLEVYRSEPGVVKADHWDEVAECVVTYLLHLKQNYGVEPALFSFNESDYGIYVKLDPPTYRDHVIRIGKRMKDAGLKTKMLLSDAASLELGINQMDPVLKDPDAMQYIGSAIAYHAWGEDFDLWQHYAQAAQEKKLDLLVTEVGADASAWMTGGMDGRIYSMRDLRRYALLLRDSDAQALMTWEWTDDYGLFNEAPGAKLTPTFRYWMLWQLANLTPQGGFATHVESSHPDTIAASFISADKQHVTIHLANCADARHVRLRLSGMPNVDSAPRFQVISTAYGSAPKIVTLQSAGTEIEGVLEIDLPAQSIVTVTTSSVPDLPRWD